MPQDWLAIRVKLTSGRGETFERLPGRVLLVGPRHSFADLAEAINLTFARWDLAHLHEFRLADGRRVGFADDEDTDVIDQSQLLVASTVVEGNEFTFVFDFGDDWTHRCCVVAVGLDPHGEIGSTPRKPVAVWGWGWIPDQYGREDNEEGWLPLRSE